MASSELIFGIPRTIKILGDYLGVISGDIQRLRHESLSSAIQFLNYAKNCHDEETVHYYIKEALSNFIKAESLEDDEQKVKSILGIYTCQRLLGDSDNAKHTLKRINDVSLSTKERILACGASVAYGFFGGIFDGRAHSFDGKYNERINALDLAKKGALEFAESF